MLLGSSRSLLAISLCAALALACQREREPGDGVPPPPEAQPTTAQQGGRSPPELTSAPEPSRRANRQRRAAARSSAVRHLAGTLERRSAERVVIHGPGEERVTLRIARGTEVTLDGRTARLESLPEGSAVHVAYESGRAGRPTALAIEGRSKVRAPGATPATGPASRSEPGGK